jgi:hypothetical protein
MFGVADLPSVATADFISKERRRTWRPQMRSNTVLTLTLVGALAAPSTVGAAELKRSTAEAEVRASDYLSDLIRSRSHLGTPMPVCDRAVAIWRLVSNRLPEPVVGADEETISFSWRSRDNDELPAFALSVEFFADREEWSFHDRRRNRILTPDSNGTLPPSLEGELLQFA